MSFTIKSPAFENKHPIPTRYTGDGNDVSPALSWSNPPEGTVEFALIVDDPDAPVAEPWVHWVLYGIPGNSDHLPEGFHGPRMPAEAGELMQGQNSWGTIGYRGPAPPRGHGVHHYHFKLYALDEAVELGPGLEKNDLLRAIASHVLGKTELVGTYQR